MYTRTIHPKANPTIIDKLITPVIIYSVNLTLLSLSNSSLTTGMMVLTTGMMVSLILLLQLSHIAGASGVGLVSDPQ